MSDGQSATNSKAKKPKAPKNKRESNDPVQLVAIDDRMSKKKSADGENGGGRHVDLLGVPGPSMSAEASAAAVKVKKDKKEKNEQKEKKEKKEKKDKKEKKARKDKNSMQETPEENSKLGYEEALGISTPSKEIVTT